ncbi:hypothetical protein OQA88_6064 [Cercophora sp. LCS_1]
MTYANLTAFRPEDLGGSVGLTIGSTILFFLISYSLLRRDDGGPPWMDETIPFISNTIEMATNPIKFWARAQKTMETLNADIVRFRLLGRTAYYVTGETAIAPVFRHNSGLTSDDFACQLGRAMLGPTAKDIAVLDNDRSGRGKDPLPGTEHHHRFFFPWGQTFADHLLRTKPTNELTAMYLDNFTRTINTLFAPGKWHEIPLWDFFRHHQTEAAARALHGDSILDKNPGYLELMEGFEMALMPLTFGPPRWTGINAQHHRAWDKYMAVTRAYFRDALESYDWEANKDVLWEPVLGGRLIRALVRWLIDDGFDIQTIAGASAVQLSNQNSNSVPASAWAVMDSLTSSDPELVAILTREAEACVVEDGHFDVQKLVTMPFLQAVYTETLRLRSGFPVSRNAVRDTKINGFKIRKGSMVQAPTPISHYAKVWDVEGHDVTEFWPRRHLREENGKAVFGLWDKRSAYFIPYGGGIGICPGRNFARQEIIATLAHFLVHFDVEVVGWTLLDGKTPSERRAENAMGMAMFRPDRDLRVRVRRKS